MTILGTEAPERALQAGRLTNSECFARGSLMRLQTNRVCKRGSRDPHHPFDTAPGGFNPASWLFF